MTRRGFLLRLAGAGAALGAVGVYARYLEPFWPTVERHRMDFPQLGADLEGLRLLQLSDLHVSRRMPQDFLHRQMVRGRALAPDVIVFTGDFQTFSASRDLTAIQRLMEPLAAPLGIFAVLGNHDCGVYSGRGTGRVGSARAERVSQALSESGVRVLRNEVHVLRRGEARLQVVGLDDLWSGTCDPELAFAEVDPNLPCVALAHNPDTMDELKGRPCDWVLCGHTHGGQVRIPFYGAPLLPVRNRQYDAGLFEVEGKRLYVNRGLGFLRPVRFNCRPEIALFTLARRA